jgi:cell division inhibitor SulA
MADRGEGLTGRRLRALEALLSCPTIKAAAKAARVGERTLRGWLKEPAFLATYRAARRQLVEAALAQMQRATGKAVKTLVACLKAPKEGDRVKAALGILDRAVKAVELIDLEERVAGLERVAALERARCGGQGR